MTKNIFFPNQTPFSENIQINYIHGFSLIELIISIGIMGILAGIMVPLGVKVNNRKKEEITRSEIKEIFEAMYGSRDKVIPNMRSDFFFDPPSGVYNNLSIMNNPNAMLGATRYAVPAWRQNGGLNIRWGFNGPYWLGRQTGGIPVDAWGRPYSLRVVPVPGVAPDILHPGRNVTVQLSSQGSNGQPGNTINYPPIPISPSAFNAQLLVDMRPGDLLAVCTGNIDIYYGGNTAAAASMQRQVFTNGNRRADDPPYRFVFEVPSGAIQLEVNGPGHNVNFVRITRELVLKPGEIREINITLRAPQR